MIEFVFAVAAGLGAIFVLAILCIVVGRRFWIGRTTSTVTWGMEIGERTRMDKGNKN